LIVEVMPMFQPTLMKVGVLPRSLREQTQPKLTMVVLHVSQLKKEVVQSQSQWMTEEALTRSEYLLQTVEVMAQFILMGEVSWLKLFMVEVMSVSKPTLMKVEVLSKSLREET
tara:strand:+ start:104 stop:442 length:339 start_codon:yes stop_codon:yes gene_type:complete